MHEVLYEKYSESKERQRLQPVRRCIGQSSIGQHHRLCRVSPIRHSLNDYSVYGLFLRDDSSVDLTYGCGKYDYRQGTLLCVAPGQIGGKEDDGEQVSISGWALLFHPNLLHGTQLEKKIKEYSFFDYRVNEALHMTEEERETIVALLRQIQNELQKAHDVFQNNIIVGNIELILNFCLRFTTGSSSPGLWKIRIP